jgi:PPOX class probable F420-dependent enzyme
MSFGMRDLPRRAPSLGSDLGGERSVGTTAGQSSSARGCSYRDAVERDDALARVHAARVGRLATVTPEGMPHVVPFVFALVERGADLRAYWAVDRKPKRSTDLARIRNLEHHPAVEFVVDGYAEDWTTLWWVRCSGSARVVADEAERAVALGVLGAKYLQYGREPPAGPVIAIDVERIAGWSADEAATR